LGVGTANSNSSRERAAGAEVRTLIEAGVVQKKEKEFKQPMDRNQLLTRRVKLRMARKVIEEEGLDF
jgi:hypothetical protein